MIENIQQPQQSINSFVGGGSQLSLYNMSITPSNINNNNKMQASQEEF